MSASVWLLVMAQRWYAPNKDDYHLQGPGGETLLLKKVLYAPTIHKNIVSFGVFIEKGNYKVQIKWSKLSLLKDNGSRWQLEFISKGSNVLYYYEGKRMGPTTVMINATKRVEPTAKLSKMDINLVTMAKWYYVPHSKQITWQQLEFFGPVRGAQSKRQN